MANAPLTPTAVTRKALALLHQKSNFIGSVDRQYDSQYAVEGAKIGADIKIRLPNQYSVRTGEVMDVNNTSEISTTLTVATIKGVDLNFTSVELTRDIDDFAERILEPAMSVLVANIESDAMSMYKDVYNEYADVGDTLTLEDILNVSSILDQNLAPESRRTLSLDPRANVDLVSANKALFNDPAKISAQYRKGRIGGDFIGFESVVRNTMWPIHVTGTDDGTGDYLINGAIASGATALTVDTGAGTFNKGDIIMINGAASPVRGPTLRVHPETKLSTGIPQQFVVTAAVSGSATSIPISPTLYSSGARQNVNVVPDDNGLIDKGEYNFGTDIGASADYQICMAYHKLAFVFATIDLELPGGVDFAKREVHDGISLSIVRQYTINNMQYPCRLDMLYGYKATRPEWACRVGHH